MSHMLLWIFTGTTGDHAFIFSDRIVVASNADFDLAAKDMLTKELNDILDLINVINLGITDEIRKTQLHQVFIIPSSLVYHKIDCDYSGNLNDFTLVVPDCTVQNARLTVNGCDPAQCDPDKTQQQRSRSVTYC